VLNKKIVILAVCGAGVGSSLMVKMNAEDILNKQKIKSQVITSDITSAKGNQADILITTKDIYRLIKEINISEVIILDNMVSIKELEEKLIPVCKRVLEKFLASVAS
jgi:PTS system ascorbate-specific IIB component